MMRAIKKILFLMTMIICIGLRAMPAFASSSSQDGLEVALTTDKESYSQSEKIEATLMVTNTNDFSISNVSLEITTPEGYTLAEGIVAMKQVESLEAGETVSLRATCILEDSGNSGEQPGTGELERPSTGDNGNTYTSGIGGNSTSGSSSNNSGTPAETGDNSNIALWGALLVISICGLAGVDALRKKSGKKKLSLFLCVAMVGAVGVGVSVSAEAMEVQNKTILIEERVTVNNASLDICATVKYNVTRENGDEAVKPTMPDSPSKADEYYFNNSEVIDVIDAKKSDNMPTEAAVIAILEDRGFIDYPIIYEYSIDGEYQTETEVSEGSTDKHPMYLTYYVSEGGEVWTIFVINGAIIANPASFNLDSELDAQLLVSESKELTSYDDEANRFYVTIPKESEVIVKVVDEINAETLDKLRIEEIEKI